MPPNQQRQTTEGNFVNWAAGLQGGS